jgi:hypothetical protein
MLRLLKWEKDERYTSRFFFCLFLTNKKKYNGGWGGGWEKRFECGGDKSEILQICLCVLTNKKYIMERKGWEKV